MELNGRSEDHQRRRYPTVLLLIEILVVHTSFVYGWRFLWPCVSHYLPDCQPLLDVIWTHILEPYAVSLFSVPSAVVLLIILCYTAAKYKFAKDIFNVEGRLIISCYYIIGFCQVVTRSSNRPSDVSCKAIYYGFCNLKCILTLACKSKSFYSLHTVIIIVTIHDTYTHAHHYTHS